MWRRQPWRRLYSLAKHLPASSPWALHTSGGESVWGLSEQLLAAAVDQLAAGNWQRGGGKGKRPKPLPRPGVELDVSEEVFGGSVTYTVDEMRSILAGEDGRVWVDAGPVRSS